MDEQQRNDQLLASAVTFLIDGGEEKAATILLSCVLNYDEEYDYEEDYCRNFITLTAPRVSYDLLTPLNDSGNYEHPEILAELPKKFHICASIRAAFQALIGTNVNL